MTLSLFIALLSYAAIAAFTPGPNNTIVMATGINHGFRAAIPMMFGVAIGFPFLILCLGFGLGQVFVIYPFAKTLLKYVGGAYMLYLAFKIATAKRSENDSVAASKPLNFLQGCAFQWVNPKAWIMGGTALGTYTLQADYRSGVLLVAMVFVFMGLTSAATWAAFGVAIRRLMNDPKWFRAINVALAVSLVLSLAPMMMEAN